MKQAAEDALRLLVLLPIPDLAEILDWNAIAKDYIAAHKPAENEKD